MARNSNRGFAAMDQERQREIASQGGRAAHQSGNAHEFDSEEAREAGRRGGQAVSRDRQHMAEIGARALAEDVGEGDVTTAATVSLQARARATITPKAPGVIYGLDVAIETFRMLDPELRVERLVEEGVWRDDGPVVALEGSARAILTGERTALNFLQRLSGVATMAARCVRAVEGTRATILDTRKTTPGLRTLEKAAVAAGESWRTSTKAQCVASPQPGMS